MMSGSGQNTPLSQSGVTFPVFKPLPNYTVWRERHKSVNHLPKVVAQPRPTRSRTRDRYFIPPPLVNTISFPSAVMRLSWLDNAYSRPLFSTGDFDQLSRTGWPSFWHAIRGLQWVCARKITSLCL